MNFIVAHKLAILFAALAAGGVVWYLHRNVSQAAAGVPVDPYASTLSSDGGFDLGSMLTPGPAAPAGLGPPSPSDISVPGFVPADVNPGGDFVSALAPPDAVITATAVPYQPAGPTPGTSVAAGTVTSSGQIATGNDGPLRGVGTPTRGGLPGVLV